MTMSTLNNITESTEMDMVRIQLFEDKLCMPFAEFHSAVERALRRPVQSIEFADIEHLRAEFSAIHDQ